MTQAAPHARKTCPSCGGDFPADGVFCPNDGSRLLAAALRESHAAAIGSDVAAAPTSDPYLGRTLLDHIEIRELVGVGAMGRVYRAFQKGIDRDVAVKILHRELSANPQLVGRFLREAKVASRLQHPNVVGILLSGQLPDGALYIVMEYLRGESLQSALALSGGAFDLPRALHVILQLCDAVGEAHDQGVVHRDLKPENVMLVRRGQDADFVKVLDFGIARLNWTDPSSATATGLIFGTARYISPEGAQGERVGPPGDVYSIGTLAYQMLSGRTPFEGEQAVGLLIQQIHETPPPLRSLAAARDVPHAVAEIVMRALAKAPSERPETARAFGRRIVEAARTAGVMADDYYARSLFAAPERRAPTSQPSIPVPHPPSESTRDVGDAATGAPTAKWTPPAAVQEKLAALAAERKGTAKGGDSVDPTLDDDDGQVPPPARTAYVTPLALETPRSSTVRLAESPVAPAVGPTGTLALPPGHDARASTPLAPPARPSAPSAPGLRASGADTVPPESQSAAPRRSATVFIVAACFLLGVGGAVALHRVLRASPPVATTAPADEHVARLRRAVVEERWDAPPGDNVRELVATGLERYPGDARILAARSQASETLVQRAVARKAAREIREAARLAALAATLSPDSATTKALAAEYANETETLAPPLATVVPTPTSARPPALTLGAGRATLDTAPAKPRVGQPVQLVAKVAARGAVTDGQFVVVAPGQTQGTKLAPQADGGAFRATFTFLEAGRYEVSFTGKADGAAVKTTRSVVVEPPQGGDSTPPATSTTPPAGSVKWL